ncbi:MAG: GAF domain-containing SpoIIE family protein phosphatase [Sporichthyaceae bacterium]
MTTTAVIPANEAGRMAAVRRYDILDTPPDGAFDHISAMAARLFGVPIAIVSIVDSDRIWFKSHHGLDVVELDRDPGLCASAILSQEPWIVSDAALDPRTIANPLVAGDFGLRFYAGVPLTTHDGFNLGTLCVLDLEPRVVTDDEASTLADLGALVMDQLELRLAARTAVALEEGRREEMEGLAEALQSSLLPPSLPQIRHVELAAHYRPANRLQVGGDFYDVSPIDDATWGLVIGDVCGKGPQAASLTSRARYSVRAAAIRESAPCEVLRAVNQTIMVGAEPDEPFVTVLFARVRPGEESTRVTLASGGHPLPALLRADGTVTTVGQPGSLLGVLSETICSDAEVELRAGDTLVLFTDGVLDSGNLPGPLEQRGMEELLRSCAGLLVADVVRRLHTAVEAAQRDDIAILALSHCGNPDSA